MDCQTRTAISKGAGQCGFNAYQQGRKQREKAENPGFERQFQDVFFVGLRYWVGNGGDWVRLCGLGKMGKTE